MGESYEEAFDRLFMCLRVEESRNASRSVDEVDYELFVWSLIKRNRFERETALQVTKDDILDAFYHKVEMDPLMAESSFLYSLTQTGSYKNSQYRSALRNAYKGRTGEDIDSGDLLELSTALSATYDADSDGVVTGDEFHAGWKDSSYGRSSDLKSLIGGAQVTEPLAETIMWDGLTELGFPESDWAEFVSVSADYRCRLSKSAYAWN